MLTAIDPRGAEESPLVHFVTECLGQRGVRTLCGQEIVALATHRELDAELLGRLCLACAALAKVKVVA